MIKYNDNTLIEHGQYKFIALCRVPAPYLIKLYENKSFFNPQIKEYLEDNIERIRQREGRIEVPPVLMPCDKRYYYSQSLAKEVIRKAANTNSSKKPVRAYECTKCGCWHLSSISYEEWKDREKSFT